MLFYVAGHGYHYLGEDFLFPVDAKSLFHNNHHSYKGIIRNVNVFGLSNLQNLLESFKSAKDGLHFSIVCFWDLCRKEW